MADTRTPPPWANRITGHGEEAPEKLVANPATGACTASCNVVPWPTCSAKVGVVQTVIVNTTTGHLIDGHLRVELARAQGQPTVPVVYVELSEEEERVILASLDPIAAMASADSEKLAELLAEHRRSRPRRPARGGGP